ncbi:hypothetical protein CIHG_02318 [Coccidioides immitis H538.4]|uniref:Uncharacterized protein n=2 Tax=Coccidioides immitis TaxID=5501 RepID=A0A0J8QZM1_COCIT|nr:hypothetical protein CISG_05676 [Coccidioides immitis RMSCC 3703]KMU84534.1 hypothetical protein CIHG_02318 [Coccidioides immitis H538.4]
MKIQERQVGSGSVIDKLSDIQMRKVTEGGGSSDADGACLWTTSSRLLQMVTTKVKSALTPRNNWTPESCAPMGGVARLKTALSIWFAPKLRGKYEYVVQHGKATIGLVRSMRSNGDVPYGGWNVCSCRVGGIDGLECIWTAKRGKAITLGTHLKVTVHGVLRTEKLYHVRSSTSLVEYAVTCQVRIPMVRCIKKKKKEEKVNPAQPEAKSFRN